MAGRMFSHFIADELMKIFVKTYATFSEVIYTITETCCPNSRLRIQRKVFIHF